jgi:hypothetical protein
LQLCGIPEPIDEPVILSPSRTFVGVVDLLNIR